MSAPVEVTTRYATTVEELNDAFAFVMAHLELVGPDPSIRIEPVWTITAEEWDSLDDGDEIPRRFTVVVEGMTTADHVIEATP